jgi:hypothetical protein
MAGGGMGVLGGARQGWDGMEEEEEEEAGSGDGHVRDMATDLVYCTILSASEAASDEARSLTAIAPHPQPTHPNPQRRVPAHPVAITPPPPP